MNKLDVISLLHTDHLVLKALTIKEPYARLMLPPYGKIETRTWSTPHRGLVLLCAGAKEYSGYEINQISSHRSQALLKMMRDFQDPKHNLKGNAYAIGELKEVRPMQKQDIGKSYIYPINADAEDNWVNTYFSWIFADVHPIEPFPYKGKLRLSQVPPEIYGKIKL